MLLRVKTFDEMMIEAMPSLNSYAISLTRNEARAEDLVQDTMVAALTYRDKFSEGTNLNAWLFVILKNKFRSGYRRSRRDVEDPDDAMAKSVPFEDSPLKKMEVAELLRLIDKMPEAFRAPLRLVADGATYEEIAMEMCEQVGTIKSRVHRGRELLKAAD